MIEFSKKCLKRFGIAMIGYVAVVGTFERYAGNIMSAGTLFFFFLGVCGAVALSLGIEEDTKKTRRESDLGEPK